VVRVAQERPGVTPTVFVDLGAYPYSGSGTYACYPTADGRVTEDFGSTTLYYLGKPVPALDAWHAYNVSRSRPVGGALQRHMQLRSGANTVGFSRAPLLGGENTPYSFAFAVISPRS